MRRGNVFAWTGSSAFAIGLFWICGCLSAGHDEAAEPVTIESVPVAVVPARPVAEAAPAPEPEMARLAPIESPSPAPFQAAQADFGDSGESRGYAPPRSRPRPGRPGGGGHGGGRVAASPPARPITPAAPPIRRTGVIASNFIAGGGVQARLSDLLDRGVLVGGQHVRLEAFQEHERVTHPVPADRAVALYAEAERARVDRHGDRVHLQISLVAKQGEAPARPRLDVRLVLDRSGSMQDEGKWTNAIAAAHALVDELEPTDTFGLISYSDDASLDVAPARVGSRRAIHVALDGLASGGGTNIGAALDLAAAHPPSRRNPTDVALVVLISDGQATVGETHPATLAAKARAMFDASGVLTTAIGLGDSFDEQTMLSIAREGSGAYHFVRRPADIGDILEDELRSHLQAVAQALRVRVVLGEGVEVARLYGTRMLDEQEHAAVRRTEIATDQRIAAELGITSDRAQERDEGLRMHLPTFRRGDQHVILMELEVPRGRQGSLAGLARVELEYKDLVRATNASETVQVTAERAAPDAAAASVRRPVKRTVLAFLAGVALQEAAGALGSGDSEAAARALRERREILVAAADLWRDDGLRRDAALLERYEQIVSVAYPGWGSDEQRSMQLAMNWFGDRRMR